MEANEIGKLIASLKPIEKQKEDLERQIKNLKPDELAMLSPLIEQIRSISPKMSVEELLYKAEEIKKLAQDANKHNNTKS